MEKELIIARYYEDVRWVRQSPIPVTVYNHGGPLIFDHPKVDAVAIPNLGREAGCYLDHICRNYDDLADWSYFAQANPHQSPEEFFSRLEIDYQDTTPLTTQYLDDFPSDLVKSFDRVERKGSVEWHWGLADYHGNRQPSENHAFLEATWQQYFNCPRPQDQWFAYGAMYAVPRKRITDRPLSYWLWVKDLVERANADAKREMTPTSAWALETVFYYLWSDSSIYPGRLTEGPGLLQKAGSFLGAGLRQLAAGNPKASEDLQASRKALCFGCPLHDHVRDRCTKCGCSGMELKRSWLTSACPDGQW